MDRRGFTLIELLIFAAVFALVMGGFITILISVVRVQSRQASSNEVATEGQTLLQQFQYYIQAARIVNMTTDVATNTLQVRTTSSTSDPTTFTLATGSVYMQQGVNGSWAALTSNLVTVSNLSFTRHYNLNGSSTPFGTDSVSYSFTMTANASNTTKKYTQSFQSSAALLSPVEKITLIQQTSVASSSGTSTWMTATLPSNVATGSLLVAAVVNTNAVTIAVATDSAANTWTQVASRTYAAVGTEVNIFAAPNAKNSSTTIAISMSGNGGFNPSVFFYEYRGAATSSSFDVTAGATSTASTTISTGSASPTSTVELVFSVLGLTATPVSPPTAGAGFTIETTSTAGNAFVEDQTLFVTGAFASTWGISPAATYTAVMATFK